MDEAIRHSGLALATFLDENQNIELSSEQVGALIYRIRTVKNYGLTDVRVVCSALRVLVERLSQFPNHVYCEDVWMAILTAILDGIIEPDWKEMVNTVNLEQFKPEHPVPDNETGSSRRIVKTSEQMNMICEKILIDNDMLRRIFSAVWQAKLDKTMEAVKNEDWDNLNIQYTESSSNHALRLVDNKLFDSFSMIPDAKCVAEELTISALARLIETVSKLENSVNCEVAFMVFERIMSKSWIYIAEDRKFREIVYKALRRLLDVSISRSFDLRCVETLEDTCGWLNSPYEEICEFMEPTLWKCLDSHNTQLLSDISKMPLEIISDFESGSWLQSICEQIPMMIDKKDAENRLIEEKINKARSAIMFILDVLTKGKMADNVISLLATKHHDLRNTNEKDVAQCIRRVYKSAVDRKLLSDDCQVKLAEQFVEKNKMKELKTVVLSAPTKSLVRQRVAKMFIDNILGIIKSSDGVDVDVTTKKFEESSELISILVESLTIDDALHIVHTSMDILGKFTEHKEFVIKLLCGVLSTYSNKIDFPSLQVSKDKWDEVTAIVADNEARDAENDPNRIEVLSLRQMTSNELNLKELLYIFRRLNELMTSGGKQKIRMFYNGIMNINGIIEAFTNPEHIRELGVQLLNGFSNIIMESGDWRDFVDNLELFFEWFKDFDLLSSSEFVSSLVTLCNTIVFRHLTYVIGEEARFMTVDSLFCLARIWNCELLKRLPRSEADILESFLTMRKREIAERWDIDPDIKRVLINRPTAIKARDAAALTEADERLLSFLNGASAHLISMCHLLPEEPANYDNEIFAWAVGVSCGGISYLESIVAEANEVLSEKYGKQDLQRHQRTHVMYYLLMGSTSIVPNTSEYDNICISDYFTVVYTDMLREILPELNVEPVGSIMAKFPGDLNRFVGNITYWMTECALPIKGAEFTSLMVVKLGELLSDVKFFKEKSNMTIHGKLIDLFLTNISLLPGWVQCSSCPINFLAACDELFEVLFTNEMAKSKKKDIEKALVEVVKVVINENTAQSIFDYVGYFYQYSDRRGYSAMNMDLYGRNKFQKSKCPNIVKEAFTVLSKYGGIKVHKAGKSLNVTSKIEEDDGKKIDEETEKAQCTYAKSGTTGFIMQHWYNCHTCGRVDTTGVCSVCAVNCHRGHDISYSKKGSFFCDCGSADCNSVRDATHAPNVTNALRGQYPLKKAPTLTPKVRETVPYELRTDGFDEKSFKEIRKILNELNMAIDKYRDDLTSVITAIGQGNESCIMVEEKRKEHLRCLEDVTKIEFVFDASFMEEFPYVHDTMLFIPSRRYDIHLERSTNSGSSNSNSKLREIAGVIKLDSGGEVWLILNEFSQAILNIYHIDTRPSLLDGMSHVKLESESLPFVPRRLEVHGNRVAISSDTEVCVLKFNELGIINERAHIQLEKLQPTQNSSNPIVRVAWCRNELLNIIAIATHQFVRIYDLTLHYQKCLEEMVLPVGNVEDVVLLSKPANQLTLFVLSTTGYLYVQTVESKTAENNSIFLTNLVPHPLYAQSSSTGAGVSIFYSETYDLLFASHEKGTYFAKVPENFQNSNNVEPSWTWKKMILSTPVCCFKETAGIISCISSSQHMLIYYIHPTRHEMIIQRMLLKRNILTQFLMTSSRNDAIYSFVLFPEMPTLEIHVSSWRAAPDLWIDDIPSEVVTYETAEDADKPVLIEDADLVVLTEGCEVISKVYWLSPELSWFYDSTDLNNRLNSPEPMPLYGAHLNSFTLIAKVNTSGMVVRQIRLEVDGPIGPFTVSVAGHKFFVATETPRFFDLRFTREMSLNLDHGEIRIECCGRRTQTCISIRSLKLLGCARALMEENVPCYMFKPVQNMPDRLVANFFELCNQLVSISDESQKNKLSMFAASNLSRKVNHPSVCLAATRLLRKVHNKDLVKLFEIVDGSLLEEWKALQKWEPNRGMAEVRRKYVEKLVSRLLAMQRRWSLVEKNILKYFSSLLNFVKLMRDELLAMPPGRYSEIALGMCEMIFGFISQNGPESKAITKFYFDMFTDEETFHLSNDIRSASQIALYKYSYTCREDRFLCKKLFDEGKQDSYFVLSEVGSLTFTGKSRIFENSPISEPLRQINKTVSISNFLETHSNEEECAWIDPFIEMIIEKLKNEGAVNAMPHPRIPMLDSPSHGLTMVAILTMAQLHPNQVRRHIDNLVATLKFDVDHIVPLTEQNFINYALFRFLYILISRWSSVDGNPDEDEELLLPAFEDASHKKKTNQLLGELNNKLIEMGILDMCFDIIVHLIPYWLERAPNPTPPAIDMNGGRLWQPHPNMIARLANETNGGDAETVYLAAVTETALRFPAILYKLCNLKFEEKWYRKLCELTSANDAPALKYCKKLLTILCNGDRNIYRQLRDKFRLQTNTETLLKKYVEYSKNCGGHQQLTELVDVISSITTQAAQHPEMWREICSEQIAWFLHLVCYAADAISCPILDLIITAVRDSTAAGNSMVGLADRIIEAENGELIQKLILRCLVSSDENLRWHVHGLLRTVIQLASRQNQVAIMRAMYFKVYPLTRNRGNHTAQLVDLMCVYGPRLLNAGELLKICDTEAEIIEKIARKFDELGHTGTFKQMMDLGIGWKAMLCDINPCLVCFNRRGTQETQKLNAIKQDAKYSANAMIYKLSSNYEVSKVVIKLTEIKKTKSFKQVTLYYSPKAVDNIVELKLNKELWRRCAHVNVPANEQTITLNLPIAVVTSSLIIEFNDVYDSQANSQLHCPRCSLPVRSASGVCENCGENAYQCIKCRAINYVDKDPFLCQSCGFCKYARLECLVSCRQLPGTQNITCDNERAQSVEEMSKLLVRMENSKAKLAVLRAFCEALWFRGRPLAPFATHAENGHVADYLTATSVSSQSLNNLQVPVHLVLQMSTNLKLVYEELATRTQQLLSLRDELRRYDNPKKTPSVLYSPSSIECYSNNSTCFGCLSANVIHAISLMGAACEDENVQYQLMGMPTLEVISELARKFEPIRDECEMTLIRMMIDNKDATKRVEKLIDEKKVDVEVFARSLRHINDNTWQQKMKYLIRYAMENDDRNISLQTLMLLNKFLENARPIRLKVYRKMAARRQEKYVHTNKMATRETRVKVANYSIATRKNVTKWLTTGEEWNACCVDLPPTTSKNFQPPKPVDTTKYIWIAHCLFSPWASVRAAANRLLINISRQPGHEGVACLMVIDNLEKMKTVQPALCDQFVYAAHHIIGASANVKTRLFIEKLHIWLIRAIHSECKAMNLSTISEKETDSMFGFKMRSYVELLCLLFSGSCVENILLKAAADDLLIYLLQSTIFLKRMVTQRTRAIDASRAALEKLLRRVSWRDGSKLMKACVTSLNSMTDTNTQGHVVSVMLEIMDPQQKAEEDFFIQIEKDAAQEDFLQGRMSGNPYKSSDPGMGPLMRDIKNKICRDTEMIALMEDDNGMELLVNNNIISLSLPVRQVYEKMWRRMNFGQPMLIVYRMRGLMGDAVESFISSFGDDAAELLSSSQANSSGRFLLSQLRKIFDRIVKTSEGRKALVERQSIPIIIRVMRELCTEDENDKTNAESKSVLAMEFYKVAELIVNDINVHSNLSGIEEKDAKWIIDMFNIRKRDGTSVHSGMTAEEVRRRVQMLETIASSFGNIVLGSDAAENVLVERYPNVFDWSTLDRAESVLIREDSTWMAEQLATISTNILPSERGKSLKQKILDSGVVNTTCDYLVSNHPPLYSPTESNDWKQFLMKPSLKMMLTLLQGLAKNHQPSQVAIAAKSLPLLHRLEQVASENSIGTLAENVMDALKEDRDVAKKIEAVRLETKQKKRQLAMAMRNKQLSKMGMQVGKGGEVKVASRNITNEPALEDETDGFICCICRESVLKGSRASAVYAFAATTQFSSDPDLKLCSVSQMVMVHIECHNNAIRRVGAGRNIDEWAKASLHNAGAKCNILTPIATNETTQELLNAALQRYLTDYEHIAQVNGGITRQFLFLDICQLVERFVYKRSFSTQSQGGGRESNMQYLAILHLLALTLPEAEGDLQSSNHCFKLVSFLFTELTLDSWNEQKINVLKAALNNAQQNIGEARWEALREIMLTWAFVDRYFNKVIPITGDDRVEWLRENIRETITKTIKFVQDFDDNEMKCETLAEFCDVTGVSREEIGELVQDGQS
ncbi:unnamed protein product [Caenorhabditis bovis]|uniref:UBR-type domain-containing protein n=1 Tax=Caenorhabditis bovis TaxID=2654633 RepID=A0A8S1FFV3_9PELO|nr:unnamed protein product [Caenorhabditis bovis]